MPRCQWSWGPGTYSTVVARQPSGSVGGATRSKLACSPREVGVAAVVHGGDRAGRVVPVDVAEHHEADHDGDQHDHGADHAGRRPLVPARLSAHRLILSTRTVGFAGAPSARRGRPPARAGGPAGGRVRASAGVAGGTGRRRSGRAGPRRHGSRQRGSGRGGTPPAAGRAVPLGDPRGGHALRRRGRLLRPRRAAGPAGPPPAAPDAGADLRRSGRHHRRAEPRRDRGPADPDGRRGGHDHRHQPPPGGLRLHPPRELGLAAAAGLEPDQPPRASLPRRRLPRVRDPDGAGVARRDRRGVRRPPALLPARPRGDRRRDGPRPRTTDATLPVGRGRRDARRLRGRVAAGRRARLGRGSGGPRPRRPRPGAPDARP